MKSINEFISKFNSLKFKFIAVTFITIVIFNMVTVYLWYARYSYDMETSTVSYINEIIKNSNDDFELMLKDINAMVISTSSNKEIMDLLINESTDLTDVQRIDQDRQVQSTLITLFMYKHYLESAVVGNFNGKEYNLGVSLTIRDLLKNPLLQKALQDKEATTVLPPFNYKSNNSGSAGNNRSSMAISIVRPVSSGGETIGIVAAIVNGSVLNDLFSTTLKGGSKIFIFDPATRKVIYSTGNNDENGSISRDFENDIAMNVDILSSGSGHFYADIEGKSNLLVYNHSRFSGWTTIGLVPKAYFFEGYKKTRDRTIMLSIISVLAASTLIYFLTHILTRNLHKLNKALKSFDKDNMDVSVNIQSHDEVGSLYQQFNHMVVRIRQLVEDIKKGEKEKRKAEMRALQAQINPHFLYNTINTIKFLSSFYGADNIRDVSESLSTLLHINMDNRSFISIREEIQYLKSYLGIQEYRYSNKFTVSFAIEEGIEDLMILKLLLQPFVENALTHGIKPKKGQGSITIKAYLDESTVVFKILDDGVGMSEEEIESVLNNSERSSGIGIGNVVSRIMINFGDEFGVTITSQPELYTQVKITLPAIPSEDVIKYV